MISTVLYLMARAAVSGLHIGLVLLSAELYPTAIRNRVVGYSNGFSVVFSLAGPYIGGGLVRITLI